MKNILDNLIENYKLTKEEFNSIQSQIIKESTFDIVTVEKPTAVIIGAQPGAGKTSLQKNAELKFSKNIVVCNADNFKDFHPLADHYKKKYPQYYPEISAPLSHLWALGLQEYCKAKKLNYILETTLQNGEGLAKTMESIKSAGFNVQLDILSVNEKLSYLGTELRFEHMLKDEGCGRFVGKEAHDIRYNALPHSLRLIVSGKFYDELNIYARNVVISGDHNKKGIFLIANNPNDPLAVYLGERNRAWTALEQEYFDSKLKEVVDMKIERLAPKSEIDAFRSCFITMTKSIKL
jgi:hypothetical protein